MLVTELVVWTSAGLILVAIGIVDAFALAQRPIHHRHRLDDILREVSARKDRCPGGAGDGSTRDNIEKE